VAAGVSVPEGFVIPATAFREAMWRSGLLPLAERVARTGEPAATAQLREAVARVSLPTEVTDAWAAAAGALGPSLAVRSSGVDEDGAARSFAGQHATLLGVAPDAVADAVRACWVSLYAERALAYRGGGPAPGALAVVVQRLVRAEVSGVMFTINPTSGSWREMVVEAVWGLGEALVSGRIAPHWYLVRRPRDLPRAVARVAERVRLQIVDRDLPALPERFVARDDGQGVEVAPTPPSLRGRATLDASAVRRLCRLGLRIERAMGGPQDVEWVREAGGAFLVLQSRPITATGTPRGERVLWTRRFLGERWPEPATPLGWSLIAPVLEWLVAYPETQARLLGGGPPLKLIHGRPYVNATVFRHLAFKLPGAPPLSFMLELVPPEEERAWRQRFAVAPDLSVYASIFRTTFAERRWERFRWNPFTNAREWDAFELRLRAALPELGAPLEAPGFSALDGPLGPGDAVARVEAHLSWVREYAGIHICSLLFANLWFQLLDGALAGWLPERHHELLDALATSPVGNKTVEANLALHALAHRATEGDLAALAEGRPLSPGFAEALAGFLERYGHRSEASWELMSPRWRRQPARLVPLLRATRTGGAGPETRAATQLARYEAAQAELERSLSGSRLAVVRACASWARRYLLLRENQRFWFDQLLASLQETLLWLGGWAVERGVLAEAEDVAMLSWDELRRLAEGEESEELPAWVAARRAQRAADAAVDPPTFLLGDDATTTEAVDVAVGRLRGLGISAGRVRGPVRVVRTLQEGHDLAAGEILVARSVDPAWTPLFLTASGVVLELGSMLSHGAVVAREYRLPAVVNIDGATSRLRTGDEVTVDGTRGIVWVH
jgi:rifampicin phosphotransferase